MAARQNYSRMQEEAVILDKLYGAYPSLTQPHKDILARKIGIVSLRSLENLAATLASSDRAYQQKKTDNRTAKYGPRLPKYTNGTRRASRGPKIH